MPPRRSSRVASGSKSSPTLSNTIDLLSTSSASPPPPAAKRARTTPAKGKSKGKKPAATAYADSDDDDVMIVGGGGAKRNEEDADAALARQLQEEEDRAGGILEDDAELALPSASTSTPRRAARRSVASAAPTDSSSKPVENGLAAGPDDPNDPRVIVRENEKLFGGRKTCKCGGEVEAPEKISLTDDSSLDSFLSLASATCPSCSTLLCRGCGSTLPNDEGHGTGECCAEGRAVVLYELLSALDAVYLADHLHKPDETASAAKKKKPAAPAKGKGKAKAKALVGAGAGTGYGSNNDPSSIYGYGGLPSYYAAGAGASNGTGYALDDDDMYGYDSEEADYDAWEDKLAAEGHDGEMDGEEDPYAGFAEWRAARKAEREKNKPKPAPEAEKPPSHDDKQDKLYLRFLTLLRPLLPSPDAPTAQIYDFLPHPTFAALLSLSTLPDLLATLLRNDSVVEWQRRSDVYFAMLGVLEALGGSEATLETLFGERRDKKWSEGVRAFVRKEGEVRWERKVVRRVVQPEEQVEPPKKGRGRKRKAPEPEEELVEEGEVIMAVPLFSLLRKLSTQAEAFRRAAVTGSLDDADASLIGICGDFAEAGERCKALVKVWEEKQGRERVEPSPVEGGEDEHAEEEAEGRTTRAKGKGKGKEVEKRWTEQDYATACGKLAYDVVEMAVDGPNGGKTFPTHYYRREAEAIANSRRPHNSFVHLAKELAVLSTSLPPGIWVRVDEARVDVLKVLIAGPEGSPYAGGLFEFDIFIPLEYPNKSPSCWLKTTGGNQCRFNPNLYAEGKVCLSLLGTWAGAPEEMWQPSKSTILQVLLSITSMILGTNYPFYNEPGYGAPRDDERNKNYNKNCSLATTRWAILDWIAGDKFKDSMWSDVIASHFLLNRSTVLSTLADWAAKDARIKKWTPTLNATAGTDKLEPFNYGRYYANLNAMAGIGVGVGGGGAAKKGKGKGKGKAAEVEEEKQPAGPPPRDLVTEVEEALEKLEAWKGKEWLDELVKKV
ncbi:hypothetical protein JCM6882_004895 [Rhodosporidiobolus microsporus]